MPTTQVINYQQDPGQKQIMDAGSQIADTLQKAQSLKMTGDYYKILAKNADTEVQKFRYQQKADAAKHLQDVVTIADPQQRGMAFKVLHDSGAVNFDQLHDVGQKSEEYYKLLSTPTDQNTADLKYKNAQADNLSSEAGLNNTLTARLGAMGAVGPGGDGADGAPGAGGTVPGTTGNSGGGYLPGDINIKGISFVNPSTDQAKANAVATGTDLAKKNIAHQQFVRDFEDFKALNDQIPRSKGGMINRAISGVNMATQAMDQSSTKGQLISAYDAASKRMATTLARQVDVGNLSETEQQAASRMIPSKYDSQGTSEIKIAFMQDMNRAIGSNDPSKLKAIIDKYQSKLNPRAAAITGGPSSDASSSDLDNLFQGAK